MDQDAPLAEGPDGALLHVQRRDLLDRSGVDRRDERRGPVEPEPVLPELRHRPDLGNHAHGVGDLRTERAGVLVVT
jgi:hypothetical protein